MTILNTIFVVSLLAVLCSWVLPQKQQVRAVSIITAGFLAWFAPVSLALLTATAVTGYYVLHARTTVSFRARLAFCFLMYGGILVYFKWGASFDNRIIPLGLSYYLFRQIHYAFEVYKKKLPPHNAEDYFSYLFFLPVILIGPINRFPEFLKDLRRRRWDGRLLSYGMQRCLYGYAKVVIIANYFFSYKIQMLTDLRVISPGSWWATYIEMIRFPLNAYFQFAGYSDIAIGLSAMMGFRIMENFNNPFAATNMNEFWKRYHISLSSWCRDYVFTPVASYTRNAYAGVIVSMLVLSLWHVISWNYLAWGLVQALGIIVATWFSKRSAGKPSGAWKAIGGRILGVLLVFHFFALSCVLIKEDNWHGIAQTFKILFNLN